jgi:hypothetical protein
MANIQIKEADASTPKTFATGSGTDLDPKIPGFQLVDPVSLSSLELDDAYGKAIMPVHIEHPHDTFFNRHLHFETATTQTLSAPALKDSYTLTVSDSSGFPAGSRVSIEDPLNCEGDSIKAMSQSAGVITLARPLDKNHEIGITIRLVTLNLAVNGSISPKSFVFRPPGACVTHVETMNWYIKTPGQAADSLFGGGPVLPRGIHARSVKNSGVDFRTIGAFRSNQRFRVYDYTVLAGDRANPADSYWLWAKINFRNENDGIIRLLQGNNDYLEVRVQDDLSDTDDYTEIECVIGGHFEI